MRSSFLIFLFLMPLAAWANPEFDSELHALIEELRKEVPNAGLAIGVVSTEGLTAYSLHGHEDVERGTLLSLDSLFMIGSTTKAFTATAAAMLDEEGRLDLDQPIRSLLPEFRTSDPRITDEATIRDALLHRVGLARYDLYHMGVDLNEEDMLAFIPKMDFVAPFRKGFHYNNYMYGTVGAAIARVEGSSWQQVVQNRLLEPLKMDRTRLSVTDVASMNHVAQAHELNAEGQFKKIKMRDIFALAPAGSIHSSINDLANWVQMHLQGGSFKGQQVVSEQALEKVLRPQILVSQSPQPGFSEVYYSLGWLHYEFYGHKVIWHNGGIDGYLTSIAFLPDEGFGVVVLTNGGHLDPQLAALTAINKYLGRKKMDLPPEPVPQPAVPERDYLSDTSTLEGTYTHELWKNFFVRSVTNAKGEAEIEMAINGFPLGQAQAYLSEDKKRIIVDIPKPWSFYFELDDKGRVAGFFANLESSLAHARFKRIDSPLGAVAAAEDGSLDE